MSIAEFRDLLDAPEQGAGPSDADKRISELDSRLTKLKVWGIWTKIPTSQKTLRETLADVETRIRQWNEGTKDETQVVGMTTDIQRLERFAEDFDKQTKAANPITAPQTTTAFDISSANAGLAAASTVSEAAKVATSAAKDALKEAGETASVGLQKVPPVVWIVGGALGVGLLLHEINRVRTRGK